MGLFDLFRSYFPANRNEQLRPNDLPNDVSNDLRNHSTNVPHMPENNHGCMSKDIFPGESFYDIDREFQNAFHQMDSMFKTFFGNDPSFDYFQGDPSIESDNGKEKSLREKMFDDSEENSMVVSPFQDEDHHSNRFIFKFHAPMFRNLWQSPFDRQMDDNLGRNEDQDLDKEYESGTHSIDEILNSENRNRSNDQSPYGLGDNLPSSGFSSAFKYSTTTKKINPDGTVETTSRKCDSDGNEEVVVSRCYGEQTHTVTNKKNQTGEEEKIESFINMDQNDLETFDEKWDDRSKKGPRDMRIVPEQNDIPIMKNLSDIFSSWWKPKL